jgi:hypothetical protein
MITIITAHEIAFCDLQPGGILRAIERIPRLDIEDRATPVPSLDERLQVRMLARLELSTATTQELDAATEALCMTD